MATDDDISFLSALANDPAVSQFLAVGSGDPDVLRGLLSDATADRGPDGLAPKRFSNASGLCVKARAVAPTGDASAGSTVSSSGC